MHHSGRLVYTSMLFMVIPLISALESLDDSLIEAAYDLGGNGWSILRQIVIPHAAPGIVAGCIVVFMLTLGNYLTPTLLGGKNSQWFTEQIYTQFITRFNWEQGAAFGFLLLGLSTGHCLGGPANSPARKFWRSDAHPLMISQ
jgi:spermidine/putrescine transport system permease protein